MTSPKALPIIAILFLAFGCRFCQGQELPVPDAPQPQNKLLLIEAGMDAGAIVFDGITTRRTQSWGCVESWSPMLYGRHPGNARFYGASFAMEGGELLAAHFLLKFHHRIFRIAAHTLVDYDTWTHIHGGINNLGFTPQTCGGGQ